MDGAHGQNGNAAKCDDAFLLLSLVVLWCSVCRCCCCRRDDFVSIAFVLLSVSHGHHKYRLMQTDKMTYRQ